MPYIRDQDRERFEFAMINPRTAGELNFVITTIVDRYLSSALSYTSLNEVVGALECVKLEMYRRIAALYEDMKRADNGEAYHHSLDVLAGWGAVKQESST